jgi:hypothetical protein
MPLTVQGVEEAPERDEARRRARKVRPQYLGGELVRVAGARNLAEAQLLQGILLEEGIPSVERRARGFDVPDFLAAGPRDILVPQAAYDAARELVAGSSAEQPGRESALAEAPMRLLVKVGAAAAGAAALVWILYHLAT